MNNDPSSLMKAGEFYRRNRSPFATYSAFRAHLTRRRHNGLIDCGAVIESPVGLLIDGAKFAAWYCGNQLEQDAARTLSP